MTPAQKIAYARNALTGHVLQAAYDGLPPNVKIDFHDAADKLVDDVATATQNPAFLRGSPNEDVHATNAIYGNGLCMLIREFKDAGVPVGCNPDDGYDGESDNNPEAEDFEQVEPEDPAEHPFKKEWVR